MDMERQRIEAFKEEGCFAPGTSTGLTIGQRDTPFAAELDWRRHKSGRKSEKIPCEQKWIKPGNGSTSKFLGVSKKKQSGKWQVRT